MQEMERREGVRTWVGDACVFGMRPMDYDGVDNPVLKPTRWMSKAPLVVERLGERCWGGG